MIAMFRRYSVSHTILILVPSMQVRMLAILILENPETTVQTSERRVIGGIDSNK